MEFRPHAADPPVSPSQTIQPLDSESSNPRGGTVNKTTDTLKSAVDRRKLVKNGLVTGAAVAAGAGLLSDARSLFAEMTTERSGPISKGDAAILRFLAAAEIIETDLWLQYNELGGIQDDEVPGGSGNEAYTEAFETIDDDMPDYIHDNTDDEITHFQFINAYL